MPTLDDNLKKIDSFSKLPNINSLDENLVNQVKMIISKLDNQPEVFVTFRESIQIEYCKEDGSYLEFEFFKNGKMTIFEIDKNENETFKDDLDINIGIIKERIQTFLSK